MGRERACKIQKDLESRFSTGVYTAVVEQRRIPDTDARSLLYVVAKDIGPVVDYLENKETRPGYVGPQTDPSDLQSFNLANTQIVVMSEVYGQRLRREEDYLHHNEQATLPSEEKVVLAGFSAAIRRYEVPRSF